jgi:hypothetical protein
MSKRSFDEFRDIVLADNELQEDLRRLSDRNEFIARVVELSRDKGFQCTPSEIEEQIRIGRGSWIGGLI